MLKESQVEGVLAFDVEDEIKCTEVCENVTKFISQALLSMMKEKCVLIIGEEERGGSKIE